MTRIKFEFDFGEVGAWFIKAFTEKLHIFKMMMHYNPTANANLYIIRIDWKR